jgi:hypothetical protein
MPSLLLIVAPIEEMRKRLAKAVLSRILFVYRLDREKRKERKNELKCCAIVCRVLLGYSP